MSSSPFLSENFIFGVYVPSAVAIFGVAIAAFDYLPYALLAPLLLGTYQYSRSEAKGMYRTSRCDMTALLTGFLKW